MRGNASIIKTVRNKVFTESLAEIIISCANVRFVFFLFIKIVLIILGHVFRENVIMN